MLKIIFPDWSIKIKEIIEHKLAKKITTKFHNFMEYEKPILVIKIAINLSIDGYKAPPFISP